MQIPIIKGIFTDQKGDFRTSYPRNLMAIPKAQGISEGYLRPADGLISSGTGPGSDRGAIEWNGVCYRVMGNRLCKITEAGDLVNLADVTSDDKLAGFSYSFDYLSINSNGNLYYWNGVILQQVTDGDLGYVRHHVWMDGYFVCTDGVNIVVTDLDNPFSVNPTKYGSSESNPDDIKALLNYNNELYALNRYTIEVFNNVGGNNFPFSVVQGATINRGPIGTRTCCMFDENIAFLGSGKNEPPSIYLGKNASSVSIATREIEEILAGFTEAELSECLVEARLNKKMLLLYVHLPDQTWVYDATASKELGDYVWVSLDSGLEEKERYRARSFVWCYNQWLFGDPTINKQYGYLTNETSHHFDEVIGWEFSTSIIYNLGNGALFHEMELVVLSGRIELGVEPTVWTSYSDDGITWSMEKPKKAGKIGNRTKRMVWFSNGSMNNLRLQKFRGTSDAFLSFARLEAKIEALYV